MSMNPPTVSGKSGPNWMLIGAAGAVGLGLLALLSKNKGTGTTAAGTSINAALGSLQEEQMNTQGQLGLLQQSIGLQQGETLVSHIDANQAALSSQEQQNANNLAAQGAVTQQGINEGFGAIGSELGQGFGNLGAQGAVTQMGINLLGGAHPPQLIDPNNAPGWNGQAFDLSSINPIGPQHIQTALNGTF